MFSEYFHEKRILANQVSLSEKEIIEYIIDGMSDIQLQNQARLQKFESASAILQAFEKITMTRRDERHPNTGADVQQSKDTPHQKPRQTRMCFNCHKEGHMRVECTQPGGGRRLCFNCGDGDHLARDCPRRTTEVSTERAVHSINEDGQPEDNYFKYVMYDLNVDDVKMCLCLYTLLDSGSPVSFIKLKYVPSEIINVEVGLNGKFRGINSSSLVVLGVITVSVNVNEQLAKSTHLLVVPDDTMQK